MYAGAPKKTVVVKKTHGLCYHNYIASRDK